MPKELDAALNTLANTRAGWVHRRDAALELSRWAGLAFDALQKHANDPDTDVRQAVAEAIGRTHQPIQPLSSGTYSLDSLAQACEKQGARTLSKDGEDYIITVSLPKGRNQHIRLAATTSREGYPMIQLSTRCGPVAPDVESWALRCNTRLLHCAFAVDCNEGGEELILIENIPAHHATPQAVKAGVKEIAHYGDWVEKRITGKDER